MGTIGIVRILDAGELLVTIKKNLDGHAMGHDLKELLKDTKIVNGYTSEMKMGEYANGMGDLAAQVVMGLKDGDMGVVITGAGDWGEWEYEIYEMEGSVGIGVWHDGIHLYEGPVRDMRIERK